jgi:hypothetical protein
MAGGRVAVKLWGIDRSQQREQRRTEAPKGIPTSGGGLSWSVVDEYALDTKYGRVMDLGWNCPYACNTLPR